jgi:hypothetical protein
MKFVNFIDGEKELPQVIQLEAGILPVDLSCRDRLSLIGQKSVKQK